MSCSSKEISSLSIQQVCSLESNNNHELQLQGNFFIEHIAGLFFEAILVAQYPKN